MKLDKVTERIYCNTEGKTGGNVGCILMDNSVAAVDAQYPVTGLDFRKSIKKITEKPVTHLLLTHYHGDHVLGNQAFEDCEIIAHALLKKHMEEITLPSWSPPNRKKTLKDIRQNRPELLRYLKGLKIVMPTQTFNTDYKIEDAEMIYTGGHTSDSSMVYIPEEKTLFSGDLIFAKSFPWGGDPSSNPDDWILAFEKIISMDVDTIIPGHGPTCDKEEVRQQLKWFKSCKITMKNLIGEGGTLEQALKYEGFPSLYDVKVERFKVGTLTHWYNFWSK